MYVKYFQLICYDKYEVFIYENGRFDYQKARWF